MAKRKQANPNVAHETIAPLVPLGALAVALLDLERSARPLVHVARDTRRLERLAALLRALAPERGVALYPEWDCLPYDRASPSRGVMGTRTGVLRWLTDDAAKPDFVLTTAPALIQRVPPPEIWAGAHLELRVGDAIDPGGVVAELRRLGYIEDDRVDEPGEVALRGRVIDVFPAAAPRPCRVEHDETRITAIRSYDAVSQRSVAEVALLVIDPATEIILAPDSPERLEPFSGQEHRLPRLYPRLASLLDYRPEARLVVETGAEERAAAFFEQIADGQETAAQAARGKTAIDGLYLDAGTWAAQVAERRVATASEAESDAVSIPVFARDRRPNLAFARCLRERLKAGDRILLAGPAAALRRLVGQAEKAAERKVRAVADWSAVLAARPGEILAIEAPLDAGFRVPERAVTAIAAADLLGQRGDAAIGAQPAVLPMGEVDLRVGDVAIDRDHGLCVFEGLERVGLAEGACGDALRLRFAGDHTLMVPVAQADRIWRYGSEADAVTLDRLEGGSWQKRRCQAEAAIAHTVRRMLDEAAARQGASAEALIPPEREMERFAAGFGFTLTPDQASAVDGVLEDLASGRPMDRLVCGDVGFGKTEVALRAAAAALFAGKQVALLAPTTVLVRQHLETFRRRFARFGIETAQLSRLASPTDAKRVKAGLADGSIQLVVGTQALAGRGVRFADLGLTIIDEEQRFGAKMKAALRAAANGAHVLTLTATPIPRTLQSALVGLQSLSVIATPPAVRQPIRTVIAPFAAESVRAALMREHRRGGQSFVVCPRIEDIAPMCARLAEIAPELDILVAHGDLKPAQMDEVMVRFADGEGDVLLATNIIESGLDVPRANTMLVWRADRFGLAQLHQLRGRVGRGQRRGVAYLLGDPAQPLPPATEKRLRTLEALDRLGAGFAISARDLDLRGAGDLVGDAQAGHVKLIGLGLYQHLLELTLRAAKGEPAEDWSPEIRLGVTGCVPEAYVPEPELRVGLYTRLLRLRERHEVAALRGEVEDRFGPLPQPVEDLITLAELRTVCAQLGITRLSGGPEGIAADFRAGSAEALVALEPDMARRGNRLILRRGSAEPAERAALAAAFLERLLDARQETRQDAGQEARQAERGDEPKPARRQAPKRANPSVA
ncbi:MAG TPA: helicase-related protein [Methylobacterium sp.]|nr:helicase-related protein [Methylobacterium sp.]